MANDGLRGGRRLPPQLMLPWRGLQFPFDRNHRSAGRGNKSPMSSFARQRSSSGNKSSVNHDPPAGKVRAANCQLPQRQAVLCIRSLTVTLYSDRRTGVKAVEDIDAAH